MPQPEYQKAGGERGSRPAVFSVKSTRQGLPAQNKRDLHRPPSFYQFSGGVAATEEVTVRDGTFMSRNDGWC